MKKALSITVCLWFVLTALYPAGAIIAACFGYRFRPASFPSFAVVLTALSVCTVVLDLIIKDALNSKALQILLALILPLSLANTVMYIVNLPPIWVMASILLSNSGCCYLSMKYTLRHRMIALIFSIVIAVPLAYFSFIALYFGSIGQKTVVKTLESPSGKYYAQVIDSDQGALGGNTLVDVYQNCKINTVLFTIEKKHQNVYYGDWGEFEKMRIYWKDDHCLVINSIEHHIE